MLEHPPYRETRTVARRLVVTFGLAIAVALAAAAGWQPPAASAQANAKGAHGHEAHEAHWSYEDGSGEVGPARWGELPGNAPCSVGHRQSPIALVSSGPGAATPATTPVDSFAYQPSRISLVNNGHTVQEEYEPGSSLSEAGVTYTLRQFHFHAPSEHTVDGVSFPLEMHLVHLDAAGKPALVVGVLVKEGRPNPAFDALFARLPQHSGEKIEPAGGKVDAARILPANRSFFDYDGSLTTPPCTEGVRWRVMRQPIEMSAAQIQVFRSIAHLAHTNRPIQPANGRDVTLISQP
jgi:carbonic anhydrase